MPEQIIETIKFIVSVLAPVLAGYIGVRYGLKEIKVQKSLDFIEKQLNQFYSPLLGIHKEIWAISEVRTKLSQTGDEVWKDKCRTDEHDSMLDLLDKEISYNGEQFSKEMLPQYNKMLLIFKNNFWLAEPETREHYYTLVEYVELWNRYEKDSLNLDVAQKIGHTEEKLKPFYQELEIRNDILRAKLSQKD